MNNDSKIYIAGHRGLVGSALMRQLAKQGYSNIVTRTHAELDLTNQQAVTDFFKAEKPEYVFLAAAKVGGIHANNTYPAEFIHENLAIQTNVIHQSYLAGVKRLHPLRAQGEPICSQRLAASWPSSSSSLWRGLPSRWGGRSPRPAPPT